MLNRLSGMRLLQHTGHSSPSVSSLGTAVNVSNTDLASIALLAKFSSSLAVPLVSFRCGGHFVTPAFTSSSQGGKRRQRLRVRGGTRQGPASTAVHRPRRQTQTPSPLSQSILIWPSTRTASSASGELGPWCRSSAARFKFTSPCGPLRSVLTLPVAVPRPPLPSVVSSTAY